MKSTARPRHLLAAPIDELAGRRQSLRLAGRGRRRRQRAVLDAKIHVGGAPVPNGRRGRWHGGRARLVADLGGQQARRAAALANGVAKTHVEFGGNGPDHSAPNDRSVSRDGDRNTTGQQRVVRQLDLDQPPREACHRTSCTWTRERVGRIGHEECNRPDS